MVITHTLLRGWTAVFALLASVVVTFAQVEPETDNSSSPGAAEAVGEVTIDVRQIGLRLTRPGEWAGFQLEITDSGSKARNVFVRLELPDPDGDRVIMQRWVVTNPGVKQSVWLYAWQPFDVRPGYTYQFSAYEAEERSTLGLAVGGGGEASAGGDAVGQDRYRPTRRIGSLRYPLGQSKCVPATQDLMAVVGASAAGLDQYASCRFPERSWSPTAHELSDVIIGLKPDDIPDRWMGLAAISTLVWTGRDADEQPSRLKTAQVDAITEWVRRGGHFIIVLPSVGQAWFGAGVGVNPLADIMPVARAVATEGVDINAYRELLTTDARVAMPQNAVVHRFDPQPGNAAGPYDAMAIMQGSGGAGDVVVVRRLVGAGAVTVVGLDLTRKDFQAPGVLEAEQFWNRVLGRRTRLFTPAELKNLRDGGTTKNKSPLFNTDRVASDFDGIIGVTIAKQSKAAKGLLAAFVVFLAYWLLAGPLGYFVLKQRNRRQHAWVLFVAMTGLFALIGWGSSSTLKLGRDIDRHYTLLDHVYGQSNQRMRSWIELTLPRYGDQRVSVGKASASDNSINTWHHALTAWEAGGETSSALASFPDARAYVVDTRNPDVAEFPARATTRQIQVDYAGSVPSSWTMPHPVAAEGVPLGQEIYIEDAPPGQRARGGERTFKVRGTLVHNLPGPLREVYVLLVRDVVSPKTGRPTESLPALMPALVYAGKLSGDWPANVPIDLDAVIPPNTETTNSLFKTWRGIASSGYGGVGALTTGPVPLDRSACGQAFFPMLEPPDPGATGDIWATRESTHNWDLGRWFTQPCIIVVGLLGGPDNRTAVETPVPVTIDDEPGDAVRKNIRGVTVVRWVYPLPPRPVRPPVVVPTSDDNADGGVPGPEAGGGPGGG